MRLDAIAAVVLAAGPWWTCGIVVEPHRDAGTSQPLAPSGANVVPASAPLPTTPTLTPREEIVPREPRPGSPQPERSRQRIADAVVVHALDAARPAFLRCFRRAQSADATLGSTKVSVELEVDPHGAVTAARTDVTDPKLAACIVAVATRLRFPAPAAPAIAQLLFLAS